MQYVFEWIMCYSALMLNESELQEGGWGDTDKLQSGAESCVSVLWFWQEKLFGLSQRIV